MRKLLMASAAILGASGGLALAQVANPSQGQMAAPYGAGPAANNNNNAWGTANTPTGSAAAGPLSTIYAPNVDAVPAPGTVVIRLNGRVEADIAANYTSSDKSVNAAGVATGYKLNPVVVGSYIRLYPGFDGLAANGLRFGASVEIREAFSSGTLTPNLNGTSTGLNANSSGFNGPGAVISPSSNTTAETLFVRRDFVYLAADKAGIVRIGQTDGVVGLFDNGIFSGQLWDGGIGSFQGGLQALTAIGSVGGGGSSFPWLAQAGNEYGNNKIVYLTPQFFGFDFGAQYAPSMGNAYSNNQQNDPNSPTLCNQAAPTCISVTSGDSSMRWYNQFGVGGRFQQTFGPVDVKAYGFYETGSKENLTTGGTFGSYITPAQARAAASAGTVAGNLLSGNATNQLHYDNLNFYQGGLAVTAMNLTAAVSYIGGRYNGQMSMDPSGGVAENALLYSLSYANGPITAGVDVGVIDSQGDARMTGVSQRHEFEVAFGGAYKVAPGLLLAAEYQYVQRHQGGYNFNSGNINTSAYNDVHGQGMIFSTILVW